MVQLPASARLTPISVWQFVALPALPVYWRGTPGQVLALLEKARIVHAPVTDTLTDRC